MWGGGEVGERDGSEWGVYGGIQLLMELREQEHAYTWSGKTEVDAVAVDGNYIGGRRRL